MIEDMPRQKPPGLLHEKNRHGTWRWVYRVHKKAPRIPLTAEYGTPEFWQQYRDAAAGTLSAPQPKGSTAKSGTLRWLVERWQESSTWKGTAEATQRQRDNILKHVLASSGDAPFAAITRQHILDGRERRQETPFAANNFLKTMRALFSWAHEVGHVEVNPAAGVKFLNRRTGGHEPWTREDVEAFRKRWPLGTRARVAMETVYATGLRRGDAVRLGAQHLQDDGFFMIVTQKRGHQRMGETVYPPMTAALREAIEAGPVGQMVYNVGADGLPMTKESFGNNCRDWCVAAGLEKSMHGLRKLAVEEASDAGCTETQLQDMFGWTTIKQSVIYTRGRRRKASAARGWQKRVGNKNSAAPE